MKVNPHVLLAVAALVLAAFGIALSSFVLLGIAVILLSITHVI